MSIASLPATLCWPQRMASTTEPRSCRMSEAATEAAMGIVRRTHNMAGRRVAVDGREMAQRVYNLLAARGGGEPAHHPHEPLKVVYTHVRLDRATPSKPLNPMDFAASEITLLAVVCERWRATAEVGLTFTYPKNQGLVRVKPYDGPVRPVADKNGAVPDFTDVFVEGMQAKDDTYYVYFQGSVGKGLRAHHPKMTQASIENSLEKTSLFGGNVMIARPGSHFAVALEACYPGREWVTKTADTEVFIVLPMRTRAAPNEQCAEDLLEETKRALVGDIMPVKVSDLSVTVTLLWPPPDIKPEYALSMSLTYIYTVPTPAPTSAPGFAQG